MDGYRAEYANRCILTDVDLVLCDAGREEIRVGERPKAPIFTPAPHTTQHNTSLFSLSLCDGWMDGWVGAYTVSGRFCFGSGCIVVPFVWV